MVTGLPYSECTTIHRLRPKLLDAACLPVWNQAVTPARFALEGKINMTRRLILLLPVVAMFTTVSFAQKAEVYGNYTYMQFNPTITGLQSRALNGGGGGIQWNLTPNFGIKGDFQGYMSTQWTVNVTAPIPVNGGVIPVGTYNSNSTMFTYLFGPVVSVPVKRIKPFAEVLFGQSNTNLYAQLTDAAIAGGASIDKGSTQHPFTMAFGGGLDLVAGKHVAFRLAEMDYVLTRYTNPWTDTNNQNHFRYLGGIVFRFGGM